MELIDKKIEIVKIQSELIYNESLRLENYVMLHFEKDKKKREELSDLSIMLNIQMAMLKGMYIAISEMPIPNLKKVT